MNKSVQCELWTWREGEGEQRGGKFMCNHKFTQRLTPLKYKQWPWKLIFSHDFICVFLWPLEIAQILIFFKLKTTKTRNWQEPARFDTLQERRKVNNRMSFCCLVGQPFLSFSSLFTSANLKLSVFFVEIYFLIWFCSCFMLIVENNKNVRNFLTWAWLKNNVGVNVMGEGKNEGIKSYQSNFIIIVKWTHVRRLP